MLFLSYYENILQNGLEGLIQVPNDVTRILNADGEAQASFRDAIILALLRCQVAM